MNYLLASLLGVVQGLAEFLPVSSSAHLILARAFFGWNGDLFGLAFDVSLHVGTLLAVLYYFRADLWPLVTAGPAGLVGGGGTYGRLARLIAIGTVPIIIFGLLAADAVEETLRTPVVCGVTLALGAVGMFVAERAHGGEGRGEGGITALEALAIGCAQAAALVPGVSRSGATITMAMLLGIRRESGARFTFLLSIPAIVAAAAKESLDVAGAGGLDAQAIGVYAVGTLVSAAVGYLAVKYFIRYLASHTLDPFAYYRLALAAGVVVWLVA